MTTSAQLEIYRRRVVALADELRTAASNGDWIEAGIIGLEIQNIAREAVLLDLGAWCGNAHIPESHTATAEVMPMGEDRESESV